MMPSMGLFVGIACPYYFGGGAGSSNINAGTCLRPYCHFKHVKKDDPIEPNISQAAPVVPDYKPAPKLLKLSCDPVRSLVVEKKRKKLEYRPDKPELQYTKSSRLKQSAISSDVVAPIYIPSSAIINLDNCNEELEELTEIFDEQLSEEISEPVAIENGVDEGEYIESKFSPTEEVEESEEIELNCPQRENLERLEGNEVIIKEEKDNNKSNFIKELVKENLTRTEKTSVDKDSRGYIKTEDIDNKTISSSSNGNKEREERRHSTTSTSSSRHKHKSSSSSSSKERRGTKDSKIVSDTKRETKERDKEKTRDKERNRDKEKNRDKTVTSNSSSSASKSSKHSNSTKSRSTSSETKHKKHSGGHSASSSTSSSLKRKHTSSSASLNENYHKSSVSVKSKELSKHINTQSSKSSSSHSKSSPTSASAVHFDDQPTELFATSEADIMKECEMIYDQLEQEFASLHKNNALNTATDTPLKRKSSFEEEEQCTASAPELQRKRVAYENAEKMKRDVPAMLHKPNHVRNAMQAIYNRQTTLRKKQEEETVAAEVKLREAEENLREANEALRKVKAQNLTPLIPKSYLTPPTRVNSRSHIMPVANILALERAKKRVEELKAEKKPTYTPAQTAKTIGRLAHKPTVASTSVQAESKPKPPVLECTSTKISFNLRMQYYDMMVKHCLLIYPNEADAYQRAQTEELHVFKKCNTSVIYKSSSLLAINKLRKEATDSGNKPNCSNKIVSHEVILAGKLAHTTSWSVQEKIKTDSTLGSEPFDKLPGNKAYDIVYPLRLTEAQLVANGYPRPGKSPGTAAITYWKPLRRPNETERYCSRCGKVFSMSIYDEVCVDECNYHPKSTGYRRGYADNQHRCCQQPAGTPGCSYANYHVSDYFDVDNLTGYIATIDKGGDYVPSKKDIYALDCEMCYTTHGIELTRVTVVDINARTVYDALVKPDNKIVDYNTIYSGITEKMLQNETRTLRDVQAILMSMFHSKTVLVGHSLESDLKALKLIHNVVVDTSVLFPHKMGPPKKRALKTLCIENLKRIIQENETGHDSAEDAEVCIQLLKFYLRNKIS